MSGFFTSLDMGATKCDADRRRLLAGLAAAPIAAWGQAAGVYPTRPVTIVVPQAAGVTSDVMIRLIAPSVSERLGQPVVVENRPGGAGVVAATHAAKAAADGHTLLVMISTLAVTAALRRELPFNVLSDFAPITKLLSANVVLAVSSNVKARDVHELFAYAKANPGKLTYASGGIGTPHHMLAELAKQKLGLDILHVPHTNHAPALQAVAGGHVDMMITGLSGLAPLVQAGKLRVLGWSGTTRSKALPEVATFRELGYEFLTNSGAWFALGAPAATPAPIIARLNREFRDALAVPGVADAIASRAGADVETSTPGELQALMRTEVEQWALVVRQGNLRVE